MGLTPGNGLCGIKVHPDFLPPVALTGIRWKQKMNLCAAEAPGGARRILFGPSHMMGEQGPSMLGPRAVEAAMFSFGASYNDSDSTLKWPPGNPPDSLYIDHPTMWLRIGNDGNAWPTSPVGSRPVNRSTKRVFPRGNFGIDNRTDLTSIEAISQFSVLEKEFVIQLERRANKVFKKPVAGWGGRYVRRASGTFTSTNMLPPGTYSCWRMSVDRDWKMDFVLPVEEATRLNPWEVKSWFTEFWNYDDKPIAVEIWAVEVKQADAGWVPMKHFLFHFPSQSNGVVPYGPRVTSYGTIEMSNCRPASAYALLGETLVLP